MRILNVNLDTHKYTKNNLFSTIFFSMFARIVHNSVPTQVKKRGVIAPKDAQREWACERARERGRERRSSSSACRGVAITRSRGGYCKRGCADLIDASGRANELWGPAAASGRIWREAIVAYIIIIYVYDIYVRASARVCEAVCRYDTERRRNTMKQRARERERQRHHNTIYRHCYAGHESSPPLRLQCAVFLGPAVSFFCWCDEYNLATKWRFFTFFVFVFFVLFCISTFCFTVHTSELKLIVPE